MKAEDLKNSILQLAMQGQLVPQNPNDEPALVLLEKITNEKEQLIKSKKIKKNNKESIIYKENGHYYEKIGKKGEPQCIDDNLFDIPDSWEWCTLGDLFYCTSGLSYKKALLNDKSDKMVRILRGGNINNEKYEFKDNDVFISDQHVKPELYLKKNILITPAVSSLEQTGKIARIDEDLDYVVVGGFVLMLNPFLIDDTFSKFYLNMLASDFHRNNCRSITRKSGQAFYNLSRQKLLNLPIVLPPLNEQKRIVSKIEEILPLIDEYGVNKEQLDKINSELPAKLKSSILQEAVQGKLVPQDPNDEPASVLLENIKQEKEQLIKAKKIKKNNKESIIYKENGHYYEKIGKKGEPQCIDDNLFDIPDSWEWCTLGDLFYCNSGLSYKKALLNDTSDKMVRILRGGNINNENYEFKDNDLFISDEHVKPELYLKKNTLITPAVSSLEQTGKIARIDKDFDSVVVGGFVLMLNPILIDDTFSKFYLNMLASDFHRSNCRSITRKSGQAFYNLSRAKLLNLPIVLPPLNEQKRIVDKVEQLFENVDVLID